MLIVDHRNTFLGVDISECCSWVAHIANVTGKGKSHVGKMDATLADSHLGTRINRIRILMNVIVLKLEYAGEI